MASQFPELEPYLPGARTPVRPSTSQAAETWLDQEMRKERDRQIREGLIAAPLPEAVARTERVARETGSHVSEVQGHEDAAERALQVRRVTELTQTYPAIGKWAAQNPRGAAMATDDYESLSVLGKAWDWITKIPGAIRTSADSLGVQGAKINAAIAGALGDTVGAIYEQLETFAQPGNLTVGELEQRRAESRRYWESGVARAETTRDANRQQYNGYLQETIIGQGLESLVPSLSAGLVGAITRSPALATGLMASSVGVPSYYDARQSGLSTPEALRYGIAQGGTEYITERMPVGTLVDLISRKTPFGQTILRELGQEIAGENVATIIQDMADWAYLPENRNKTLGDYISERPQAALDTTLATIGGVAGNASIVGAVQRATDATSAVSQRVREARQAHGERAALDEMAKGAESSKLKQRDPEAFRALIRQQAEEAGATSVFIPGEAIRTYNQSEGFDPDNDPLAREDAAEAAATGGDVVMPIEDFLTDVVGTPAWDAIKDDVRLTQGGMSTREAQAFDDAMSDIMEQAADELSRAERSERDERSVREQLVDRVATMFGESFTSPVARQYAEIAVQRAQTRAQRLGTELQLSDFDDVTVRQILPEGIAEAVSADRLDLVINAMRAGQPAEFGIGPSLLQFIGQRGGINDVGGDLASMGVPPRYLRDYDPAQAGLTGGVSGAGDFGIDSTLRAAIEAGYFPDLANIENEQGPSALDTQRLLDAVAEELAGRAVFAETRTDDVRASAEDLRQILEESGYAPDNMTDEDIRDVVEQIASAPASEGVQYEQADPVYVREGLADALVTSEEVPGSAARDAPIAVGVSARPRRKILSRRDVVKKLEQEARGRVVFEENRRIIELFKARDLSTPIHEMGHMWLEELGADAALPDAPEQLRDDWNTVRSWFTHSGHAIAEDGTIPVEAHELFARSIERYFMEGKAPTSALTRIFENVRQWMLSIYRSATALRAEITPEIREVFDRMLASDEEIAAARERQGMEALFKQAADAGMTQAEFEAYQAKSEEANAAAHAKLLERVMGVIRRRETERYREARRTVRAEEAERIDNSPVQRALNAMDPKKDGTRISKEWVVDRLGLDALDLLPRRVPPIYVDGGANPDAIAEMAGYSSGTEMLETLIGVERVHRAARDGGDKRSMRDRMIETATDEEMNRRYGDPLNDGSIEAAALEAVQSEMLGEVVASEIRALGRKSGRAPLPYQVARSWARAKVQRSRWIDVASPGALVRHSRNAARAAKAAEAALIAGDHAEAYRQKQFQMLNNALAAEAYAAADEVETARKRMDAIANARTRKAIDQDYLEEAQMLLEAVDLKRRSQIYEKRKGSFAAWAAAREAEGFEVVVPETFEATIGLTNWSKMPVADILMLDEAIRQIMHLGRLKQSLIDGQEERQWEEIYDEAVASAENLRGPIPADLAEPRLWDSIKKKIAGLDATLLKMETVFDWLDGGNPGGVFNRIAFRPIAEAQAREADMVRDYQGRIKALFEAVPAEIAARWQDRIELPFIDIHTERPMVVNRQQLIAMALNVGNEGNLQRLADGYRLNGGALIGYLDATLTKEEWQFVQSVWDTIDTLWPEIAAVEKSVNGVPPDKVRARKFDTSTNGQMRGGYYPAVYDSTRNYRAQEHSGQERDLLEGNYTRATTRASSTKERSAEVNRQILLDLGVINRHLGEVIHDITHREAVIRANRFLSSEKVRRAVDAALGQEIGNQFRPWVKFVANSWAIERAGNEGIGKFLGRLRANTTAVGMGLRGTTMMTQLAGYSNTIEVVGEAAWAKAMAQFVRDIPGATRSVMERSDEVRNRMNTLDRDIRTEIARLSRINPASKAAAKVLDFKTFFFHGIGYMDLLVSVPTWMAAYDNALKAGMSEADAAYAGDKAVRISQGAGGPKDLAAIQRGTGKWGEALKLMTMFYSYFSALYQRERTLVRDARGVDQRRPRNVPRLASRAFFLIVLPPLLTEVLRAGVGAAAGPDDDEWWTQWVLRKMLANSLGPIPMVRDVFEPTWNAARGSGWRGTSVSPVQRALESIVKVGGDVGKIARGEETKSATKNVLETAGFLTGLVPGQIASTTQFLVDIGYGDADPDSVWDWLQGLSTGKIED